MEIGKPLRVRRVEPIETPLPSRQPSEAPTKRRVKEEPATVPAR
jgi:hypothetical protein